MITLAFAQMFYYLFVSLKQYGGDDGLSIAVRSDFLPAWRAFAGDDWLELPPDEEAVERWAQAVTAVAA